MKEEEEEEEEGEDRYLRITKVVCQGLNFIWSEVVFIPQDMIMCWSASTLSMQMQKQKQKQKQNTRCDFTDEKAQKMEGKNLQVFVISISQEQGF